jgi:chlorite dismutase
MTIFAGGSTGPWRVLSLAALKGEPLGAVTHLTIYDEPLGTGVSVEHANWLLRGVRSHLRYVERSEKTRLDELSPPLGRPEATRAALLPIRKSSIWWDLPQDERRAIFEDQSRHIADSMKYMPAVARRLYHARDLGEPFDFLTWFEFAPQDTARFDDLLRMLRATEEWTYVEREVEIRLTLTGALSM